MSKEKIVFSKKIVEQSLKEPFYKILAKFPELDNLCIFVKETKFYGEQHTLRAYPPFLSIISPKRRRIYPIVINSNKNMPISFFSLSEDEKVGAMAHEFGHILDYSNKNSFQVLWFMILFMISRKYVKSLETKIDTIAIERGFGYQLLQYRQRIINEQRKVYKEYLKICYMDPAEISEIMSKYPEQYKDTISTFTLDESTQLGSTKIMKHSFAHILKTFYSFFPGLWQMIVFVYVKKVHIKGHF